MVINIVINSKSPVIMKQMLNRKDNWKRKSNLSKIQIDICIYTYANRPKVEETLFMGSEDFFPVSCLIS